MKFINDMVTKIVSMEQIAIFALLREGISFSRMCLYRKLNCAGSEQGVRVDGKIAFSIVVTFPDVSLVSLSPISVMIEGKFHPPFDYMN